MLIAGRKRGVKRRVFNLPTDLMLTAAEWLAKLSPPAPQGGQATTQIDYKDTEQKHHNFAPEIEHGGLQHRQEACKPYSGVVWLLKKQSNRKRTLHVHYLASCG